MSVRVDSSPRFVVLNATVKTAISRATVARTSGSVEPCSVILMGAITVARFSCSNTGACFTDTPAFFCSSRVNAIYFVTKSLRTGFPFLRAVFQTVVIPRSFS